MSEEDLGIEPIRWDGEVLHLIDQLKLPAEEVWIECRTVDQAADAIRNMNVRGAPAIGITAAYGVVLAARAANAKDTESLGRELEPTFQLLADTRPTAVNLFWALGSMRDTLSQATSVTDALSRLQERAVAIHQEDIEMCLAIGRHGRELIIDDSTVLTHCNAGALATGGYGTALGVLRAAKNQGKTLRVLADETRPYLQGARLTAWELAREGFDVTLIPDAAAPFLISRGRVDAIVVGADRIARNGDTANKIGTYSLALAARAHGVPFYVAAPMSTIDMDTASGEGIPIEERSGDEMTVVAGTRIAPDGAKGLYPAFDVTPAELITAIITDRGVARAPFSDSLRALL